MYDTVLFDCETDGIEYSKLHCVAVYPLVKNKPHWEKPLLFTDEEKFTEWAEANTNGSTLWVAHNACGFDYWAINDLTGVYLTENQIVDTSILTKLDDYRKFNTHSLKEIGEFLGVYKGDYDGGWDEYTPTMGDYCVQDVVVLYAIWKRWHKVLDLYPQAVNVEHDMAFICNRMQHSGFRFDTPKAQALLDEVTYEMTLLEDAMAKEWPPELVEDRRIKWRETKKGEPYATCLKAIEKAPKWERQGDELVLWKYKDFNPGSSKDRVDKLWDAGWSPFDKTKGHIEYERSKRYSGHFK